MCYYIGYDEKDLEKRQGEIYVCIFISFVHIYFLKLNIVVLVSQI